MTNEARPIWYDGVPMGFWTQSQNRRAFIRWLERKLDVRQPEDWYQVSQKTVHRYGGESLLALYYRYSVIEMLRDYMPWYDWKEWLFPKAPSGFWKDFDNRRRYLEWLGAELSFTKMEDWYGLKKADLVRHHGTSLLKRVGSPPVLVMSHFPEHDWIPWKFPVVPDGYWNEPANVRRYLEWLGEKLGFKEPEDWYGIHDHHLLANRGGHICGMYKGAAATVMKVLYPDYEWRPWKFFRVSRGFWEEPANVRRYLEWLGAELGFEEPEDWYVLEGDDLKGNHGASLVYKYGTVAAVLNVGFPEHDWKEWWFNFVPDHFWDDRANVRRYLEWLGEELGLETMADWYQLTADDIWTYRGRGLLERHHQSAARILIEFFPERGFKMEEFKRIPATCWHDPAFCRRFLEKIGRALGFEEPEDWYRLTARDFFIAQNGRSLLRRFDHSPAAVLRACMPEHDWKEWLFDRPPRGFWQDRRNRRRYLDWLADKLGIRDAEGWGRLGSTHFDKNKGSHLMMDYEYSVRDVILDTYPPGHPAVTGVLAAPDRKNLPRRRSRP